MSRWLRWLLQPDAVIVAGLTGFGVAIGSGLVGWDLASDIAMALGLMCLAVVQIGPDRRGPEPAASPAELRTSRSLAVFFAVLAVLALTIVGLGTATFHRALAVFFLFSFALVQAMRSVQITRPSHQRDDGPADPEAGGYLAQAGQPGGDAGAPSFT